MCANGPFYVGGWQSISKEIEYEVWSWTSKYYLELDRFPVLCNHDFPPISRLLLRKCQSSHDNNICADGGRSATALFWHLVLHARAYPLDNLRSNRVHSEGDNRRIVFGRS